MIHINKFIDKIKAVESKGQANRQFPMTIDEARNLHGDITKLLLGVQALQQQLSDQQAMPDEPAFTIEIEGEKW
jgi:hypothetical protein